MPRLEEVLRTALFLTGIGVVLIFQIRRSLKRGFLTRESYQRQRPLIIAGFLAFALFAAALGLGISEPILYWIAAVCVALPIGALISLFRSQGMPTQYPQGHTAVAERIFEMIDRFPFAPTITELAEEPELIIAGRRPAYPLIQDALDLLVASGRLHWYGSGNQRVYYTNAIQLK